MFTIVRFIFACHFEIFSFPLFFGREVLETPSLQIFSKAVAVFESDFWSSDCNNELMLAINQVGANIDTRGAGWPFGVKLEDGAWWAWHGLLLRHGLKGGKLGGQMYQMLESRQVLMLGCLVSWFKECWSRLSHQKDGWMFSELSVFSMNSPEIFQHWFLQATERVCMWGPLPMS